MKFDDNEAMEGVVVGNSNEFAPGDFDDGSIGSSGKMIVRRLDQYDVNFEDTRPFAVARWEDIVETAKEMLSISGN